MKFLSLAFLLLLSTPALAQQQPAPDAPMAVVTNQDLQELNSIITEQVPQRWAAPTIAWMNKLIQREAQAREKAKTEDKK